MALIVQGSLSWWSFALLLLFWFTITTFGSFAISFNFFLTATHHQEQNKKRQIFITFDDGPHPIFTPQVLNLLKQHKAKATFFLIGKNAEQHLHLVKQILQEGHSIGNHSYSHSNSYGFWTKQRVVEDIQKTEKILKEITKQENQLFRPPFGVTNPNIAYAVNALNLQTIGWSIRSFDTVSSNSTKVFKRISKKLQVGDIILLHDSGDVGLEVLEMLLEYLEKEGYEAVPLRLSSH